MKQPEKCPTIDEMIAMLTREGPLPRRIGQPASAVDAAAHAARVREFAATDRIRFVCIGCGDAIRPKDAAPCVCGGFVCPACRRVEDEGVYHHEAPDFAEVR